MLWREVQKLGGLQPLFDAELAWIQITPNRVGVNIKDLLILT
jgi:hypothetical protein